ncbi:MAG: HD domain-containing protein, partial [Vallitaleaceae bacterium]|nr:HD domain-containing protein [Vallitaleaceae bacterium]
LLIEEGIASNMTVPLLTNGYVFGLVFFSSKKEDHFSDDDKVIGEKIVNSISSLLIRAYFTKVVLNKVTNSFSQLVDQKDNDTGEHLERMTTYTLIVARGLQAYQKEGYVVSDKFLLELERNAAAHDIGKVGIPDDILKKPGKLTPDEWEIMKTHTSIGADIFSNLRASLHLFGDDFFQTAETIARYHHEKWNGSGYPEGLSGENIPLAARIVAIGDVFDALTSKRVYKNAFSFEDSVATLVEGKGQHFDPFLIEVFLEQLDEIQKVYMGQ